MTTTTKKMTVQTLMTLRRIVPTLQFQTLNENLKGPERDFFRETALKLESTFESMPRVGDQDDAGESAIVHLHYFSPSCDWWITERDPGDGQFQAYGLADMGFREFGYIPITELLRQPMVELDYHWKPRPAGELLK